MLLRREPHRDRNTQPGRTWQGSANSRPEMQVLELVTETQPDNWVRVTGVRVRDDTGAERVVQLAPPTPDGRQSVAVIALGTIESTRLALTTFQASLAGRAAQRMGQTSWPICALT